MALIIFRRNKTLTEYEINNICWYFKKKNVKTITIKNILKSNFY